MKRKKKKKKVGKERTLGTYFGLTLIKYHNFLNLQTFSEADKVKEKKSSACPYLTTWYMTNFNGVAEVESKMPNNSFQQKKKSHEVPPSSSVFQKIIIIINKGRRSGDLMK